MQVILEVLGADLANGRVGFEISAENAQVAKKGFDGVVGKVLLNHVRLEAFDGRRQGGIV